MWRKWATDTTMEGADSNTGAGALQTTPLDPKRRNSSFRPLLPRKGDFIPEDRHVNLLESSPQHSLFPSTRYYGSKRRQLEWLKSELLMVSGETALDAFGGTGAVSYLLQSLGWQTSYNDIFEFNIVTARALFSNSATILSRNAIQTFLKRVQPVEGFVTSTFEGLYFTTDENMWLDGYMVSLQNESPKQRDLLLYCLFQACLKKRPFNLFHRANLNLRYSQMPVQFGNRSTWSKSFATHILATYDEVHRVQTQRSPVVNVSAGQCATEIAPNFDLVYLDPPYFKKRRKSTETYVERYHFLEGLARYTEWEALIDPTSPIQSFRRPYRQEWVNKDDVLNNIRTMITKHRGTKFALSYVAGEEPSEEELYNLFRENFDRVRLSRRSFGRVLSTKETFEILLIGQ